MNTHDVVTLLIEDGVVADIGINGRPLRSEDDKQFLRDALSRSPGGCQQASTMLGFSHPPAILEGD